MLPESAEPAWRFRRIAAAGILFQGGAAAIDTGTVIAALVEGLTGSAAAVGAAAALARAGWLVPQLFVGYVAQRRTRRMPFYMAGAFGRAACLAALAGMLGIAARLPSDAVVALFFLLWTVYAFIGGVVAVPYNDIVARAVPSDGRSRLLAVRFFGGGLLALAVAASAHRLLDTLPFASAYAAIVLLGAALFLLSALSFVSAGEPRAPRASRPAAGFALFLGAQTAGALLSNPLWGWWGDWRGKRSLLEIVAVLGAGPPFLTLAWVLADGGWPGMILPWFAAVFFLVGAAGNGATIAQLGYLMEISPDARRPAYSGYFNALAAPATLLPLAGAAVAQATSFAVLFAMSLVAALLQLLAVRRLRAVPTRESEP